MPRLILFNKPYGVICQFSPEAGHRTLKEFIDIPGVYPAGRLDTDSEGLLLLTDDGRLQSRITEPRYKLAKTYWVQTEGTISDEALRQWQTGIQLKDGLTRPATARRLEPPDLWPRDPPIRFRKNQATDWLELSISEGRNRQVRRMTAAAGFPTLRLIRVKIGPWTLGNLAPGEHTELAVDAL